MVAVRNFFFCLSLVFFRPLFVDGFKDSYFKNYAPFREAARGESFLNKRQWSARPSIIIPDRDALGAIILIVVAHPAGSAFSDLDPLSEA